MMFNLRGVSAYTECYNKRLSAKTNLKLAKLWLDRGEYTRLSRVCPNVSACLELAPIFSYAANSRALYRDRSQREQ